MVLRVGLQILQVIVLTTFWLVLIGIASFVTNRIAKGDGDGAERNTTSIERAETWDFWIEITLAVVYVVANVVIFVPAWMKQRRDVRLLTQDDPDDEDALAEQLRHFLADTKAEHLVSVLAATLPEDLLAGSIVAYAEPEQLVALLERININ